ncbi:MAG TPA: hypothetical protein VJ792_04755 [Candidatus Nitrosotalea sp.]|nr:hypothetical protein [Candidatus Nitrosotalea sp.]
MKAGDRVCAIVAVAFLAAIGGCAYASDSQVVIVNGTANHCLPYPSCYKPYEIDIRPGDTVTWINNDTKTHTVTAGTPNYGPVGMFDSGSILPQRSYAQFFGSVGKYPYYDKVDMWPSGVVVVSNQNPTRAEISWVNGSLSISTEGFNSSQKLVVTKQVQNTGSTDANSVNFRLRIHNSTGFLFYDKLISGGVPARQNSSVSFTWDDPKPGKYSLNFDAVNLAKQQNENEELSSDLISISQSPSNVLRPIIANNFELNNTSSAVPEFGQTSASVLLISAVLAVVVLGRSKFIFRT